MAQQPGQGADQQAPQGRDTQGQPTPARLSYAAPFQGSLYPPLGYSPEGRAQYVPGQTASPGQSVPAGSTGPTRATTPSLQTPTSAPADEPVHRAAPEQIPSRRESIGTPSRSTWKTVAAIVVLVALAAGALTVLSDRMADDGDDVVTLPLLPDPREPQHPDLPGDYAGRTVEYEVTMTGMAMIIYIDDKGPGFITARAPSWRLQFPADGVRPRVMVAVDEGESASCTIRVDGEELVTDEIGPDSPTPAVECAG